MVYSRRSRRITPTPASGAGWREIISKRKKAPKGARGNGRASVRDYASHVLVCKGGDCKKRGSGPVRKVLKDELRAAGMNREVRVDAVGCLGLCKHGPNVIVYPSGTWYVGIDEADVPEVVSSHLRDGEPVPHLAAERRKLKKRKG